MLEPQINIIHEALKQPKKVKFTKSELLAIAINCTNFCVCNDVEASEFTSKLHHIYSNLNVLSKNQKVVKNVIN